MAPVTGGVADRQQYRAACLTGQGKGLFAPGLPVDRVVFVLKQIGAGLVSQAIGLPWGLTFVVG